MITDREELVSSAHETFKNAEIATRYDRITYQSVFLEYYGYSNFSNFGYWRGNINDQKSACEALIEKLLQFLPGNEPGRILDVACGKGGTTKYLLNYFEATGVSAIDISIKQLKTARSIAPECAFVQMEATHLAFKNESFDKLMCVEAAFHFITREQFLKEAYRVLRPGGYLLLSDILMTKKAERNLPYHTVRNYLKDLWEYEKLCKRIGFIDIQIIDATKECWHGCFWNMVRFSHEKFLTKHIDFTTLNAYLEKAYRMVGDVEYYLLAVARKG